VEDAERFGEWRASSMVAHGTTLAARPFHLGLGVMRLAIAMCRPVHADESIHFALGFMVVTLYTSPFLS
jgi:hypothetical protein